MSLLQVIERNMMAHGENPLFDLRKRTVDSLSGMPPDLNGLTLEDIQTLVHGLRVHQIELELQNEELRKTQYALEEAQSRYIDLYDFAPVGYFTLNQAGVIEEVNLAGASLVEIERSHLIQRPFSQMVYSEDQDACYLYLKKLFKTLSPNNLDIRLVKSDGAPFAVRLSSAVVKDGKKPISHCRMIVSDITEQNRVEQQAFELAAHQENIRTLANFIRSASHEFRTPLSNVLVGLYLLRKSTNPTQVSDYLNKMEQQVKYIVKLVEALTTMARLDGGGDFNFESIRLNSFIEEASNLMKLEAQEKSIQVEFELDSNLSPLQADRHELYLALWHILNNAVHYTDPGGIITIRSIRKAESVLIEVQDTGMGISEADIPYIFERFYRVDLMHSVQGLGLGLSIANQIIRRHGGKIEVESSLGQGSLFRIILPLNLPG